MKEKNQEIIQQLKICGNLSDEIHQLESNIDNAKKRLEKIKSQKPTKKETTELIYTGHYERPIKISFVITAVSLLLAIVFVVLIISHNKKRDDIFSIVAWDGDPGEKYINWLEALPSYKTFEELEESWIVVQKDWKSRGLDISWEYVKKIYESSSTVAHFDSKLRDSIRNDINDDETWEIYAAGILFGIIALVISARYLITQIIEYRIDIKWNLKTQQENNIIIKYNEEEYPILLQKWEKQHTDLKENLNKTSKLCNEKINLLREKLTEEEKVLYNKFNLERCYFSYTSVANTMERDFISYERALQKLEKQQEEFFRAVEESTRRFEEERRYNETQKQNEEQLQATKAQTRAIEEQNKIIKENIQKQEQVSMSRCYQCVHKRKCSFEMKKNSINCSGFIHD